MLRANMVLTAELSDALLPKDEAVIKELLPELSELVVVSGKDPVDEPFSSSISARHLRRKEVCDVEITTGGCQM